MIQILADAMMVATCVKQPEGCFDKSRTHSSSVSGRSKKQNDRRKFWRIGRDKNDV